MRWQNMDQDERYMKEALAEARKAAQREEVPVGAVAVIGDRIVGRGYNKPVSESDPTAHAEIVALRDACRQMENYRLPGCDLYVTLEPCAMCLGAAVQARVSRLVFGAYDSKSGAVGSAMSFSFENLNHRIEIKGGILAAECGKILKDFFEKKR